MHKYFPKLLLILTSLLILIFATAPGDWTPAWIVNHDKFSHMLVFFILALMLSLALPRMKLIIHTSTIILFALSIESMQLMFAARGFSFEDILFDIAGLMLFYLLVIWAKYKHLFAPLLQPKKDQT